MNTEQDLRGEDTEETNHPNENYDSGTDSPDSCGVVGRVIAHVG